MISKISASPAFKGNVTIGQTQYEKKQIAKTIMSTPDGVQQGLLNSIVNLKTILQQTTPDKADISIGLYDDIDYYKYGVDDVQNVYVTVTKRGDEYPFKTATAEIDRRAHDLKPEDALKNINNAFAEVQLDVTSKYEPIIKKPETFEEVLDIIA